MADTGVTELAQPSLVRGGVADTAVTELAQPSLVRGGVADTGVTELAQPSLVREGVADTGVTELAQPSLVREGVTSTALIELALQSFVLNPNRRGVPVLARVTVLASLPLVTAPCWRLSNCTTCLSLFALTTLHNIVFLLPLLHVSFFLRTDEQNLHKIFLKMYIYKN